MEGSLTDGMAFALTTMLTAIGLFVVSVWMLGSARTHTARKTISIKRTTRQLESECTALEEMAKQLKADYRKVEAEEKALVTENNQIRKACAAATQDTFEVVHEVGTPTDSTCRFDVEVVLSGTALTEGPAASQIDPRVWGVRNVAQIWATTPQDALQMANRAFPSRFGYVVTRFLNSDLPKELTDP